MIRIDHEKCTGCGLCSKVCSQGNGNIVVHEKAEIISQECQRCGQCIEVCPAHAIDWDITATELKEIRQMPDSRSFGDVIINRKSIRNYLRRPIDTEILEASDQSCAEYTHSRQLQRVKNYHNPKGERPVCEAVD